jgi:hypothetical protein
VKQILLLLTLVSAVQAAEPIPFLQEGRLGVVVSNVRLPPTVRKDLVSGLSNHILVQVTLAERATQLARTAVGIDVKYDLWDETFSMQTSDGDTVAQSRTYRSLDEAVAALSRLSLPGLFKPEAAWRGQPLVLSVEVLFDPIEKERMDELRQWVAENSTPSRTQAGRELSLPADAPSESRAWFNRIFSQYAAGAGIAAAWQDRGTSAPFRLEDLSAESPSR